MRSDGTFSVRLPAEWRDRLSRQAEAVGMTAHAFVRATLIGRLRRLAEMEHGRADPDAPLAVRLRLLLHEVEAAAGQGVPVVSIPTADTARLLREALRLVEAERAG